MLGEWITPITDWLGVSAVMLALLVIIVLLVINIVRG